MSTATPQAAMAAALLEQIKDDQVMLNVAVLTIQELLDGLDGVSKHITSADVFDNMFAARVNLAHMHGTLTRCNALVEKAEAFKL